MIFTATSIVAIYFDNDGYLKTLKNIPSYEVFKQTISDFLKKRFEKDNERLEKIQVLLEVFNSISPNIDNNEAVKKCIENLCEISDCVKLSNDNWKGEDVMGIFFNEFNRYKGKSESGQVFTPDHITSFICKLLEVNSNDVVLDATCGSGAFLTKAMAEMIKQVEYDEQKTKKIKTQIYGIEFDKEIFALACANMLIHNDGKSGLINGDSRTAEMEEWIKAKQISKVLMNPPFENKFGCLQIVLNVLNNVKEGTKCAFILPDKKLEKASKNQRKHLLQHNRIEKIIKLPTNIFKQNTETSIFIITAGVPQNDKDIYTCYIEDDGLETLKNQGRHDINNKWRNELEAYWLDFIEKNKIKEDVSAWIKPNEHLSFQTKQPEFEIYEEDFRKTIFEYYCFKNGIDVKKYKEELVDKILYSSIIKKENNKSIIEVDDEILQSSKNCGEKIDTSTWKKFDLKDLFEIEGTGKEQTTTSQDGNIKLVSSTGINNGVSKCISNGNKLFSGNKITLAKNGCVGKCFYQKDSFYATSDVFILKSEKLNQNIALFIMPIIESVCFNNFSWNDKINNDKFNQLKIPLPTTTNNQPDWKFMEGYIKSLPYGDKI